MVIEEVSEMALLTRGEQRAKDLLKELDIETAPVDPVDIAKRLGYTVRFAKFKDGRVSGILHPDGTIFISIFDSPKRQRFTVAHELGHALLHGEDGKPATDLYRRASRSSDPREKEANDFAGALLVPQELVELYAAQPGLKTPHLARLFEVSEDSMHVRLDRLGLLR